MRIYMASKTAHADKWKQLRNQGIQVISTWIDEAGPGESQDLSDLWWRCISESSEADATIVYREEGEVLKGAFIEVGSALASGKIVVAVGYWHDNMSFLNHPGVVRAETVKAALQYLEGLRNAAA